MKLDSGKTNFLYLPTASIESIRRDGQYEFCFYRSNTILESDVGMLSLEWIPVGTARTPPNAFLDERKIYRGLNGFSGKDSVGFFQREIYQCHAHSDDPRVGPSYFPGSEFVLKTPTVTALYRVKLPLYIPMAIEAYVRAAHIKTFNKIHFVRWLMKWGYIAPLESHIRELYTG